MKWLDSNRMGLVIVGVVAGIVLSGGRVKADFIWTQKADMPITKYLHSTSVVGGKIYSIGGYHLIGEWNPQWEDLKRVDEYDPATNTWTRKADIPTARGYTSTCVVNDKIYVLGGDAETQPISIVEVYDPATDTWAEQTELPTKRWSFTTSVVDGIIYVVAGNTNPTRVRTVEAYDPKPTCPWPDQFHQAALWMVRYMLLADGQGGLGRKCKLTTPRRIDGR